MPATVPAKTPLALALKVPDTSPTVPGVGTKSMFRSRNPVKEEVAPLTVTVPTPSYSNPLSV